MRSSLYWSGWCHQRLFDGPSAHDHAMPKCPRADSLSSRPISTSQDQSVMDQPAVIAAIRHLFFLSGPSNIARLIVAVIIDAINRVRWGWLGSNVRQERFERRLPFVAHSDASSAVVRPLVRPWIQASRLNRRPSDIFSTLPGLSRSVTVSPVVPSGYSCLSHWRRASLAVRLWRDTDEGWPLHSCRFLFSHQMAGA